MKALNIGCGSITHPAWVNLDFAPSSLEVEVWDIRKGLPYANNSVDYCYSSHLIEHLTSEDAYQLLTECFRILKPKGILRVAVPDLETIARNYLRFLEQADSGVKEAVASYDWTMLELYDQVVRDRVGGSMGNYLANLSASNRAFVESRIGLELNDILVKQSEIRKKGIWEKLRSHDLNSFLKRLRILLASGCVRLVAGKEAQQAFKEGLFRRSGEVHLWMYDRFSLRRLFEKTGFSEIKLCRADESCIPNFNDYCLDVVEGKIRKPDSLFIEGRKL